MHLRAIADAVEKFDIPIVKITSGPRIALVGDNLTDDQAIDLITRCLDFYREHGRKKERASRFMERIGLEEFKKQVL